MTVSCGVGCVKKKVRIVLDCLQADSIESIREATHQDPITIAIRKYVKVDSVCIVLIGMILVCREEKEIEANKKNTCKRLARQKIRHRGFPCHLCPQYWSGPIQFNFRDRTGSGVFWMV